MLQLKTAVLRKYGLLLYLSHCLTPSTTEPSSELRFYTKVGAEFKLGL